MLLQRAGWCLPKLSPLNLEASHTIWGVAAVAKGYFLGRAGLVLGEQSYFPNASHPSPGKASPHPLSKCVLAPAFQIFSQMHMRYDWAVPHRHFLSCRLIALKCLCDVAAHFRRDLAVFRVPEVLMCLRWWWWESTHPITQKGWIPPPPWLNELYYLRMVFAPILACCL